MNMFYNECLGNVDEDFKLSDSYKTNKVKDFLSEFILSDDNVNKIIKLLENKIEAGLIRQDLGTLNSTAIGMKITFFTELFDGTESGDYVVINLNKRHLLLALVNITPGFLPDSKREFFTISEDIRNSPYIKIFEFLCECLLQFFTKYNLLNKIQIVGFCSDLPTVQVRVDEGTVCYFSQKVSNFPLNCYDMKRCFEIVLRKPLFKDIKIKLVAIMSENTSMLYATSYCYGNNDMLLNFENDCDLLYWEDINKVTKWDTHDSHINQVLIDSELRDFGNSGCLDFLATEFDWYLISHSSSTIKHCALSRLLPLNSCLELIKQILLTLHHNLLYCRAANIESLQKEGVSLIELSNILNNTSSEQATVLLPGGTVCGSKDDFEVASYVCKMVLSRSAQIKSICIATFSKRIQNDDLLIVMNCSLIWKSVDYEAYIQSILRKLALNKKFQFIPPENYKAFIGSALATAVSHRVYKTQSVK